MNKIFVVFLFTCCTLFSQNFDELYKKYIIERNSYNFTTAFKMLDSLKQYLPIDEYFKEMADLYELSGDNLTAAKILSDSISSPLGSVGLIKAGNNYFKAGYFREAINSFNKIDSSALNYYLLEKIGDVWYSLKDVDSALMNYTSSIKYGNNTSGIYLKLARLYVQREDYDLASDIIKSADDLGLTDVKIEKLKTEIMFKLGDYINTINSGLKVVNYGDTTYSIIQKMGIAYYFIADQNVSRETDIKNRESLRFLAIASSMDERDPLNYFYMALNYSAIGIYDSSAICFENAINSFYPSYTADVYMQAAFNEQKRNKYSKAIHYFIKAREHAWNRKEILFYLANSYDMFYEDKYPAKNTYQNFVKNNRVSDPKLINYALQRIEYLTEYLHFNR